MKKINNSYVLLLASYATIMCAMHDNNAVQLKKSPAAYTGENGHEMIYNPKIYVPRDAAGKPLIECSSYHQIQATVVKHQDIAHSEGNNVLMAASLKALEAHEKKAKL